MAPRIDMTTSEKVVLGLLFIAMVVNAGLDGTLPRMVVGGTVAAVFGHLLYSYTHREY
jgi:hypothetical protein